MIRLKKEWETYLYLERIARGYRREGSRLKMQNVRGHPRFAEGRRLDRKAIELEVESGKHYTRAIARLFGTVENPAEINWVTGAILDDTCERVPIPEAEVRRIR